MLPSAVIAVCRKLDKQQVIGAKYSSLAIELFNLDFIEVEIEVTRSRPINRRGFEATFVK